jgi:hypothetical protein
MQVARTVTFYWKTKPARQIAGFFFPPLFTSQRARRRNGFTRIVCPSRGPWFSAAGFRATASRHFAHYIAARAQFHRHGSLRFPLT